MERNLADTRHLTVVVLSITRLKKVFNFNMLYVFPDVIMGFPGDDDSIEINENDHKEFFNILLSCFDNVYTIYLRSS